jgi:hypothetical protein
MEEVVMKNFRIMTFVLSFVLIAATTAPPVFSGSSSKIPETATLGENFTIATAYNHAYAIRDGVLWAWGVESDVDEEGRVSFQSRPGPEPIMNNAASVRTTGLVNYAVTTDGALWSWGISDILRNNRDEAAGSEPTRILDGVGAICAEIDRDFAFAIKNDGSLWGWGANESYQLGDGTQEDRSAPVKIMDDVKSVRIMNDGVYAYEDEDLSDVFYGLLVYAVKTDGSLWKWGTATDYYATVKEEFKTPVEVTEGAEDIIAGFKNSWPYDDVAEETDSGYEDNLIRKTDGTIWQSGRNGGNPNHDTYGEIVLESDDAAQYRSVSFDANGGNISIEFYYRDTTNRDGKLLGLPEARRVGPYVLTGWFTEPDGGTMITTDTVFTSDSTVYAHWGTYVPVTDVTGLPAESAIGTNLILDGVGTVEPADAAANKNIRFSIDDPGDTGAVISYIEGLGTVFSASKAGTARLKATVVGGLEPNKDYVKYFDIRVRGESGYAPPSGGNSGTGGGSAATSAPASASAADGAVSVDYVISGGDAKLSLPDGKLSDIIAKSENTAVFDLSKAYGATAATLPKAAFMKLTDANLGIDIKLPQGAVKLSEAAAVSAATQANGSVSVSLKANPSALNDSQKEVAADRPVYDISVTDSTGGHIVNFNGGLITVSIPYELKAGETPDGLIVYYLDVRGGVQKMETAYDAETKSIVFTTDHLSLYVIAYEAPEEQGRPWINPFRDVDAGAWYYGDVEYAVANGLYGGTSATAFEPNTAMTRGMLATVLARLDAADLSAYASNGFNDVDEARYYAPAVGWAASNGVVNGVGDNKFAPDRAVTRQEMAVMLLRYSDFSGKRFPTARQFVSFADEEQISDWAKNAARTLYCGNIVSGRPGDLYDPRSGATRAEVAAILHRFANVTE